MSRGRIPTTPLGASRRPFGQAIRTSSSKLLIGVACTMLGVACRAAPQAWPSEAADLTGQVVAIRRVSTLGGTSIAIAASKATGDFDRLEIRVLDARGTAPATSAYIGVDGITTILHRDSSAAGRGRAVSEGAFVRVWFRSAPRTTTATQITAMARAIAIDSIGPPPAPSQR